MTVTVTPAVEPSTGPNDPPRIRLDVTGTGETSTTVTRLDPDGRTVTVRTSDGNPLPLSGDAGLLYDYEAPFGAQVTYSSLESPGTVSASVTLDEPQVWLIHPGVPELSTQVRVAAFGGVRRAVNQAVFRPLGRATAVVHTDGARQAPESSLQLRVEQLYELNALEALTSDASTLLLNIPADLGWGVSTSYIAVGDIEETRLVEYASEPTRYFDMPYTVVARPVGGSQSERTYTDVLADNASYADLVSKYPSYLDLLAGP